MKLNKKRLISNKRGDLKSIIIMIIIVASIALVSLIFSKGFLDILGELKQEERFSDNTIDAIEKVEDHAVPLLDFLIFFSLIGLMIALVISSIYMKLHPAWTVVFIVGMFIAVFLAGQFANIWAEVSQDDDLASTAEDFTFTNIILGSAFPIIIFVVVIIVIIVLYGKGDRSSGL